MRKVIDKEKLNQFVSTLPFKEGWLVEVKDAQHNAAETQKAFCAWMDKVQQWNVAYFPFEIRYDDGLFLSATVHYILIEVDEKNTEMTNLLSAIDDTVPLNNGCIYHWNQEKESTNTFSEVLTRLIRYYLPYCEYELSVHLSPKQLVTPKRSTKQIQFTI